ncbi:MAG: 30S ribosomal protein S13 [Candidatus Methanoperedenaceae archaeon HGW-Methanoperedenaceae-1]|jgi:small subunit ribosomal protein S13|nr:MAG: 30S ribosomal protein S13 [Candidatus Methanoperedenaceae archaeon HGW-Methanoperedenaceae-1]
MAKEDNKTKIEKTVQAAVKQAPVEEKPKEAKKERKNAPPKGEKKPSGKPQEKDDEIKHLVRIAGTDLKGSRSVLLAMTGIKGINRRVAKILVLHSGVDPKATIGYLEDAQIEKLQSSVDNISNIIPTWMMNKQNELISGEYKHVIGTDVYMSLTEDLNTMKKTRSYKGLRHDRGLRVRGQRTRATGRRGTTVGVSRSAPKK